MADYLSPTPYANPLTGLSNDVIQGLLGYMKDKQRTQQMQGLAGLLESTGIPQTVERAAYAQSPRALLDALTNVNRANVPLLKAETADALMNIAPMVGPAARGAERAAMAAGRAGERYAEKVVPQIMDRGGMPAQLLGDLSQGSIRPMDVWHGSPNVFGKFNPEKASRSAYGFGTNLAESKDYATGYAQKAGNLYKVDLPDEKIASMLDWDAPIGGQSAAVQSLASKYGLGADDLGGDLLAAVGKGREGAEIMRQNGIAGVKYANEKAGANAGQNFVVFPNEEQSLKILERNGMNAGGLLDAPVVPVSESGFYSAVDNAAQKLSRNKGTGKEFMTELRKQSGVKKAEIDDRGLAQIEDMPKMSREEFLAELEKRPATKIKEEVWKDPSQKDVESQAYDLAYEDAFDELRREGMSRHDATDEAAVMAEGMVDDYLEQARETMSEMRGMPYHSNYTLEGGSNYREFLLKHPEFEKENKLMELEAARRRTDPKYNSYTYDYLTKQIDELNAEKAAMPEVFKGVDAHYGGEQGILASMRAKDRVGPNGEKILNIEEIQSDWHQQGRDKGYHDPEKLAQSKATVEALKEEHKRLGEVKALASTPEEREAISEQRLAIMGKIRDATIMPSDHVPNAPFKKNWEEVALKRALNEAAKGEYDKLALTTGAEQADRYNLAKRISEIKYDPETNNFFAKDVNGNVVKRGYVPPEELPNYVGNDLAEKIAKGGEFTGLDLKTGGEGMKGFYDKKLVNYLNDYGKKYGVNVGQVEADGKTFHSFDITPEMRADILKGQPLYSAIPSIGLLGTDYEDLLYRPNSDKKEEDDLIYRGEPSIRQNLLDW